MERFSTDIDVRTLGIEGDRFIIINSSGQQFVKFHLSDGIVEVCAANRSSQPHNFSCTCSHTVKHPGDLTRHKNFCGTQLQHLNNRGLEAPILITVQWKDFL